MKKSPQRDHFYVEQRSIKISDAQSKHCQKCDLSFRVNTLSLFP